MTPEEIRSITDGQRWTFHSAPFTHEAHNRALDAIAEEMIERVCEAKFGEDITRTEWELDQDLKEVAF